MMSKFKFRMVQSEFRMYKFANVGTLWGSVIIHNFAYVLIVPIPNAQPTIIPKHRLLYVSLYIIYISSGYDNRRRRIRRPRRDGRAIDAVPADIQCLTFQSPPISPFTCGILGACQARYCEAEPPPPHSRQRPADSR